MLLRLELLIVTRGPGRQGDPDRALLVGLAAGAQSADSRGAAAGLAAR